MNNNIYNSDFVRDLFNRMSSSYERMNYITSFGFSIRWRKQFLRPIKTTNDEVKVIDLLTGMGETWVYVRKHFTNPKFSALDFSPGMLDKAKIKNKKHFNNGVTLFQQDILKNELPSNNFDIVICAFGLKTFDDNQLEVLALETKRILKEGGQFSFIEVSKPTNSILRVLYKFYLGRVIPILGRLLLGDPIEYKMLWLYTNNFNNSKQATQIFNDMGLNTTYISYFGGCATGFYGKK